jgi:hypothetical protein
VLDEVINPIVKQCVDHFIAKEASMDITAFRNHALTMAENLHERQFIQTKLHEPTLRLRQMKHPESGNLDSSTMNWNANIFWEQLSADLADLRQNVTSSGRAQLIRT